jgi:hypothetical protein
MKITSRIVLDQERFIMKDVEILLFLLTKMTKKNILENDIQTFRKLSHMQEIVAVQNEQFWRMFQVNFVLLFHP